MTDLKLNVGEGILLQTSDAGLYDGNNEIDIEELYLTNKNIIYVHEKSTGFFKTETVVDKIPLSSIAVINGAVQVEQVDDIDYGKSLQIIYTSGKRELLELNVSPKKQYPAWKTAITNAVIGLDANDFKVQENTSPQVVPVVEEKRETSFAGATLFAGFKGVVDAAKKTFAEVTQSGTEMFNSNSDAPVENNTPVTEEQFAKEKKYIFCCNCGEKLFAGSKFCNACGTKTGTMPQEKEETVTEPIVSDVTPPPIKEPVVASVTPPPIEEPIVAPTTPQPAQKSVEQPVTDRRTVYEGTIHKCPNCGEVLESFTSVCLACGYELRNSSTTSAVKEFAAKLDGVTTEYQKENIIRSFPIPNTKEDIFEFMILASSNIDERPNKDVFNAWIAKFEQCYQKAKLSFKQESDFVKIEAIYEKTNKTIKKLRRKGPVRKLLTVVLPIVVLVILCVIGLKSCGEWLKNPEPHGTDEEVARLEAIVVEVEKALENKEYDLAMMQAKSIDFFPNHEAISDHERQWDIKRDYLIKKVISAAAEDGITMEYPTDTADETDRMSSSYN